MLERVRGNNALDCAYHLPGLCDCEQTESMVQEEFLEVPPETKPSDDSDELTPQEEAKFSKFLDKFLADDDTSKPETDAPATPQASSTSAQPLDIAGAINKALDERESKAKSTEELTKLRADVELLKPQKPKWWQPFTPFSPR